MEHWPASSLSQEYFFPLSLTLLPGAYIEKNIYIYQCSLLVAPATMEILGEWLQEGLEGSLPGSAEAENCSHLQQLVAWVLPLIAWEWPGGGAGGRGVYNWCLGIGSAVKSDFRN